MSVKRTEALVLAQNLDGGGIEVGVALPRGEMDAFGAFSFDLVEIDQVDCFVHRAVVNAQDALRLLVIFLNLQLDLVIMAPPSCSPGTTRVQVPGLTDGRPALLHAGFLSFRSTQG
jgi:hypothetical protein